MRTSEDHEYLAPFVQRLPYGIRPRDVGLKHAELPLASLEQEGKMVRHQAICACGHQHAEAVVAHDAVELLVSRLCKLLGKVHAGPREALGLGGPKFDAGPERWKYPVLK